VDEKGESVKIAFKQINIAEAARQAEIPESTLRYDLNKLKRPCAPRAKRLVPLDTGPRDEACPTVIRAN
jgi:hypothetical protein